MTFDGAFGDMQTLAHELGHGFHNEVMGGLRIWQRTYPMTLAETRGGPPARVSAYRTRI